MKPVTVRQLTANTWELVEPVEYQGKRETFHVPAGIVTDFATVPRVVVWLIPKYGDYTPAAVLHDWFCDYGIEMGIVSPVDADGLFRRILRELGVSWPRRWLMWTGVRWGALFTPKRRPGWLETAAPVLLMSVLAAPLVIPAGLIIALSLGAFHVIELAAGKTKIDLST